MLLAYNATSATIAANLGKWRPNAANPTGLYVPKLSDQFFRAWGQGPGDAGRYNAAGLPEIFGGWTAERYYNNGAGAVTDGAVKTTWAAGVSDMPAGSSFNMAQYVFNASGSNPAYGASPTVMPASVDLPVCLYLGIPA